MIKLGMVDFDTSHSVEFTKRLNHKGIAEEQWVDGATVVLGHPGESKIEPERIPGYAKEMQKLGVTLVDKPEDMIGKVDGIMIESQDGSVHWDRARPFIEAGLPCFIDKPFACSVADAGKLVELAEKKKVPLFSSSSLRYAPEVVQFQAGSPAIRGVFTHGLAHLHDRNPGLYHYGIHPVELLYTLMGPGCTRVGCIHEKGVDLVTGQWQDGRVATIRGDRPRGSYGFLAFLEKNAQYVTVGTAVIYRELLKKVVQMFETRKAPLDIAVTVEIIAFIEAAWKSANNHGVGEKVL